MHNLLPSNNVLKSIISIEQYSMDVLFDRFYDYIIVLDTCDIITCHMESVCMWQLSRVDLGGIIVSTRKHFRSVILIFKRKTIEQKYINFFLYHTPKSTLWFVGNNIKIYFPKT